MKLRCLIVDDEPLAQQVIEKYISSLDNLELVRKCNNALEAMAALQSEQVDLVFLDIKMPELSGIDFLKTLVHKPAVILTTAYSEYALEGYEHSVTDYLLKPISFERFLKAVNRVFELTRPAHTAEPVDNKRLHDDYIFVKADKAIRKVKFSDILYIEGAGNYIKLITGTDSVLVQDTMTGIEKQLPEDNFIRVHKSFIISIRNIDQIEGNIIRIGKRSIPIGKYYKRGVEVLLKDFYLKKQGK
ncbi:MAG: response regulator transcription factor [bacterium]|nr:response regulator transcription factor [bacterium]